MGIVQSLLSTVGDVLGYLVNKSETAATITQRQRGSARPRQVVLLLQGLGPGEAKSVADPAPGGQARELRQARPEWTRFKSEDSRAVPTSPPICPQMPNLNTENPQRTAKRRSALRRARSVLISRVAGLVVRGLAWYAQRLTREGAGRFGASIGRLALRCTPHRRGIALRNIAWALQKSGEESSAILAACYLNLGKCLVEFLRLPTVIRSNELLHTVSATGEEHLKAALAKGNGVVLITGHFGNWELMGARLAARGYHVNALARHQNDKSTTSFVDGLRGTTGMRVIWGTHGLVDAAVACLRRGEIVAFLVDQNAGREGTFVDFFGRLASTHTGAAVCALTTGAAVIPAFGVRNPDDTHSGYFLPEVELVRTGSLRKDIEVNTAAFTKIVEAQIRLRPDMWFWLHDRWRARPPSEETR